MAGHCVVFYPTNLNPRAMNRLFFTPPPQYKSQKISIISYVSAFLVRSIRDGVLFADAELFKHYTQNFFDVTAVAATGDAG